MPLITISQNLGSGGKAIATLVANGLDLELYDDARLQTEALKSGVRSEDLKHLGEKMPNLFDRILGTDPNVYIDVMESVVYDVSKQGRGVIIGHCSQMLLRDFNCALHVRINAPETKRIENLMRDQGITRENAAKLIDKSDRQLTSFYKYAYDLDLADPSLYDIVVNTEKLTDQTVANHIIELAGSDEISTCSLSALEAMEKLAQKKKVEAALLRNNISLHALEIAVHEKGRVSVSGLSSSKVAAERIPEMIRAVPGIEDVTSSIVVVANGF
jgi:cytidylate kinase